MVWLKKADKFEKWIDNHTILCLIIAIVAQFILCFIGVQLSYILQFFIGYFVSRKSAGKNEWVSDKAFRIVTILAVVLSAMRLVARQYIDGSILYDMVLARLSFNAIAICLVMVMTKLGERRYIAEMVQRKCWKILDLVSYPLFLTHYMFLKGPMSVVGWSCSKIIQICMFFIATVGTGFIVLFVTENRNLMKLIKSKQGLHGAGPGNKE